MELMTMENLFAKAGLNWKSMEKNVLYDIADKNIRIKSYNHEKKCNEMSRILGLIRKDDAVMYNLITKSGDILLKCSGNHRIWDSKANEYYHVQDIESGNALNSNGEIVEFFVKKTNEVIPIVDMSVEGNTNYFTNGILSHNTSAGGKALRYYASIRLQLKLGQKIKEKSGNEEVVRAVEINATTAKNKTAAPFQKTKFQIVFGKGIDNDAGILEMAIANGIIVKKGGWFSYDGENIAQGLPNVRTYLEEHPDAYEEIKRKVSESISPSAAETVETGIEADAMTDEEIANSADDDTEVGEV